MDTSDWKLRGAAKPAATLGEEAVFNPHERPCGVDNFVRCELVVAPCLFSYWSLLNSHSPILFYQKVGEIFAKIMMFVEITWSWHMTTLKLCITAIA